MNRKKGFAIWAAFLLLVNVAEAQLSFRVNLPPAGLTTRAQLWNITLVNPGGSAASVYIECRMTSVVNGNTIMTAVTNPVLANPGTTVVSPSQFMPVQYNMLDPLYQGFSLSELLPVGSFQFCYVLWTQVGDRFDRVSEDCLVAVIEPMAPPILVTPEINAQLDAANPVFTWLPPSPIQQFMGLTYDISIVEVGNGQSPVDAVRLNLPVMVQGGLSSTALPYSQAYARLETGRQYAWQITARSANQPVAVSDVWPFTIKGPEQDAIAPASEGAYPKLSRERSLSYAIMQGDVRIEYLNTTADTIWNVQLTTLSAGRDLVTSFSMDSIKLRYGKNLVRIREELLPFLEDRKLYQLQLRNSNNEVYWLRFEYRRRNK